MKKIKITVLKRTFEKDFAEQYGGGSVTGPCTMMKEGDVFITGEQNDKPAGFCVWAWDDIFKLITTLSCGGDLPGWMKESGTAVTNCSDGLRPVFFKLERIE